MLSGRNICRSCQATGSARATRSIQTLNFRSYFSNSSISIASPNSASKSVLTPYRIPRPSRSPRKPPKHYVRFQSTIPPATYVTNTETPEKYHSEFVGESPDAISNLVADPSEPVREIGFLKNIYNLDFGYGPSSLAQYVFEHVHVYGGTDMWLSIAGTALVFRLLMAPIMVRSTENAAKLSHLRPLINDLMEKIKTATAKGDTAKVQLYNRQRSSLMKEHGISPFTPLLNLLQLPLGFGYFRVFRNMSAIPVAGMAAGGTLWFQNLVVPDPYYMLPLLTGLCQFVQMRHAMQRQPNPGLNVGQIQTYLTYVMPAVGSIFLTFQPAVLVLYFFCSSTISLAQHFLLYNKGIRVLSGQTPFAEPGRQQEVVNTTPYQGTISTTAHIRDAPENMNTAKSRDSEPQSAAKATSTGIFGSVKQSIGTSLDKMSASLPGRGEGWKSKQKEQMRKKRIGEYEQKRANEFERDKAEYQRWIAQQHRPGKH